jgi:hypothetical protein
MAVRGLVSRRQEQDVNCSPASLMAPRFVLATTRDGIEPLAIHTGDNVLVGRINLGAAPELPLRRGADGTTGGVS